MLNHYVSGSEAAELGAKLRSLLRLDDATGKVDALIEKQRIAEEEFTKRGYAVWRSFPQHPFAAGLLEYERWLATGTEDIPLRLRPFIECAYVIESFRQDWGNDAQKLAADLRSDNKVLSTVFEFIVLHQFRLIGHNVTYIFPQESSTYDGLINHEHGIEVECKLSSSEARRQVPHEVAVEVYSQLMQFMQRNDIYAVVSITCADQLTRSDIQGLIAEAREALRIAPPTTSITPDGRFTIDVTSGGSPASPLDAEETKAILNRIDAVDASTANVLPPSQTIAVPNRYLVQGVSIDASAPDNALGLVVKATADASGQLTGTRPGIAAVGFGSPILRDQPDRQRILSELQRAITHELRNHPKVSAVHLMFQHEGQLAGPPIRGGLMLQGWTGGLVYAFRSPHATCPIPQGVRLVPTN